MKQLAALLICFTLLIPSLAQDVPQVITPENAASLTLLESAGSALPTNLRFSPDSRYILASTTDETFVFPADDPDAEPQIFPFSAFSFDADGYLFGGGQRWNLDTGQSIGIPPSLKVVREAEGDPAVIEVIKPGGETIHVETQLIKPVSRIAVDDAYTVLAVASEEDWIYHTRLTVYLYELPTGNLIAALPGISGFPIYRLHFTHGGYSELLLVESMDTSQMSPGEVALIRLPDGTDEKQYGGTIWEGVRFSPDGKFAYRLEDKIVYGSGSRIGAIPYADDEGLGSTEFLAVTSGGVAAVFSGDALQFATFTDEGRLGAFVTVPLDPQVSRQWTTAGDHVVMNEGGTLHVWDILSDETEPRIIELDLPVSDNAAVQLSPDLSRYRYVSDGRLYVHDTATNDLLADLPGSAIISPDWSRAAYWDGKRLTVDDFAAEQDYLHEVNPRHLGEVADFENGYAAFIDGMLQVVDVDSTDGHTDTVTIEGSFDGAHLFDGGACIVTIDSNEGNGPTVIIHSLNPKVACEEATYSTSTYITSAFVTPSGSYLVGYDMICGSDYWMPETRVFPLEGYSDSELQTNFSIYACGLNSIAFTRDETTVYVANSTPVLRGTTSFSPEKVIGEPDMEALLIYADPVEDSFAIISGVFLSPTEDKIAVYIEDSKGADWVQERYIEIFALDDLQPGTLRRDVRPLLTIPDATVAYFSPDGRHVVTDAGLYSIEAVNQTPAVSGTISAFSPDSQVLATYQDGFVTLWRVSEPNANNFPLAQYDIRGVRELTFSADGTRLYVVRAGEVQAWGVAP